MSETEHEKPGDEDELEVAAKPLEDLDAADDVQGGGIIGIRGGDSRGPVTEVG